MSALFGFEPRSSADLSPDGLYRYSLSRSWAPDGSMATFIMLNPSTANADQDDPTIRRCIGFAKAWGCSGVLVGNLYALRSTDPDALWSAPDPVGPDNDAHLVNFADRARWLGWPLVAAWGMNAKPERVAQVVALPGMEALQALGVTKSGAPRHPLYLRTVATLYPWPVGIEGGVA